ncbi:MAG: hypothetical protein QF453_05395 [Candidatus Marinimicrobia bacterium]|jgi:hypothetical protein|nr:hypothetical protein [Candidatus Neomarinimicrobiota bacterium]
MKPTQLMDQFESLADKLGFKIIQGKGDFNGGGCTLREKKVIVINKLKPIEQRLRVLAQEFAVMDLEGVYVVPVLRKFINEYDLIFPETV